MKYLIVLPEHKYYLWQMLVQINNFRKIGCEEDTIYVIGKNNRQINPILDNFIRKGKLRSSIYVYNDDRTDFSYSPSLTAHLLGKFFKENPNMSDETFFYIDPDVILKKKIKFKDIENNDIWYVSDTRSYLNSKYIKSKGDGLLNEMCSIIGIDRKLVEDNDDNAGGAQLLIKKTTPEFWKKVEIDSVNLYKHMINTSKKYCPNAPIQAWTAEMWSLLWNAWLFGHETKIIKRFDFSWATDPIKRWDETNIFHNAGAVEGNDHFFIKTRYQTSPFNKIIECSDKYCSYRYLEEIKDTEKNFKNILF